MRTLLVVTGLAPQVLTETLFALCCRKNSPAWIPDEVRIITTRSGAEHARLNLLVNSDARFHRFVADYHLPQIKFDVDHIHVIADDSGTVLDDIRTPLDNAHAADAITRLVRELTADPERELHVSLAGGRKTMGYYLGYALSLYGRPQDCLSHVLVSEPFENNRDFYYPTPYDHPIHVRQGNREITRNARDAIVELAEIPFVRLRHGLPVALLTGNATFRETVDAARASLDPPRLVVHVETGRITTGTKCFKLPPAQFALYAVFAWRAAHNQSKINAPIKDAPDLAWSYETRATLIAALGQAHVPASVDEKLHQGADGNYFSQTLSRLHKALCQQLGPVAASYRVDRGGPRAGRFGLSLPPEAISFERN